MEEIINRIEDDKVFKNLYFLFFKHNNILIEYEKLKYDNPEKFQVFGVCSFLFTLFYLIFYYFIGLHLESDSNNKNEYYSETFWICLFINIIISVINYNLLFKKPPLDDKEFLKFISFLLNLLTHYYFIINYILLKYNMHYFIGFHILLKYGYILLVDSNFLGNLIVTVTIVIMTTIECIRRSLFEVEILFIYVFYIFYVFFVYYFDKREKKIQYSIISMRMENERLESLLTQASQIILERERRNQEAEEAFMDSFQNNNTIGNVIANSVNATIQAEPASNTFFKYIS